MVKRQGKIGLVTGASGGIGEAFAHVLAQDGYSLVLVARSEAGLNRVRGILAGRHSASIIVIPLDLSLPGAPQALADELSARSLRPDVVINNAGFGLAGKAAELPVDQQSNMIDLNVRALTELSLRCLPAMLERKSGGIINVASVAAFMPGPNMAVYFATKAFVVSFSDALHEELRGSGVNVMSLCPGPVETGFQLRAGLKDAQRLSAVKLPSAASVAARGWAGFIAGERQVIPGIANKIVAYTARGAPRRALLPIAGRAMARSKA